MMGTTKTAIQYGMLAMIFFISGISALRCHSSTSVIQNGSQDEMPTEVSIGKTIITCTNGQNACVEAQVTLSAAQTLLLVIHRGCANNKPDGAGSNRSGDPHFTVTSNVSYCFRDLCNWKMSRDAPWSPGEETGPLFIPVLIKTCQRSPCIAPKSQSFGPIEIHQWGSCCNGSYCNGTETAPKIQNTTGDYSKFRVGPVSSFAKLVSEKGKEGTVPASAVRATLPGHPVKTTMISSTPVYDINYDSFENISDLLKPHNTDRSEAVWFQSCPYFPLLIALGTAVFGAWW